MCPTYRCFPFYTIDMFLKKKKVVPKLNFKNIELLPEFTEKHISPKNPMTKVFEKGQKEHFEF